MFHLLLTIYFLLYTFLTWRNFNLGLFLFFLLLPTYLIRFNIGPLPTTLLEVMLGIIIIIWIVKFNKNIIYHLSSIIKQNKNLFIAIALFLVAATISIFTSTNLRAALGEWKAFYIEPIILFLIITTSLHHNITLSQKQFSNLAIKQLNNPVNSIISALILSGLATSLLAIYQHFTGWLVPYSFWQNQNTFRVTAWYGFPNAVGLFLAPLVPLAIYLIYTSYQKIKEKIYMTNDTRYHLSSIIYHLSFMTSLLFLLSAPLAVFFAKSTGALIGLAVSIFFLFLIYKKTRWLIVITCLLGLLGLFSFSGLSGIKQELLFQDRSGQIRLSIWNETWDFLKDNPIWGAGLASYQEKIKPYHTTVNGEGIEIFHHPHNIFLTMWINLGLLGLFAFIWILVSIFNFQFFPPRAGSRCGGTIFKQFSAGFRPELKPKGGGLSARGRISPLAEAFGWNNLTIYLLSSMITILVIGLVDSPYIKNDLAILFWLLPALLLISNYELEKSKT